MLQPLEQQSATRGTLAAAFGLGVEEARWMPSHAGCNRGLGLLLLPALVNQLADQAAFVLAAQPLELVEAALGFRVQPHSEGHGKDKLGQPDGEAMSYTIASCRTRSSARWSRRQRSTKPASRAATR